MEQNNKKITLNKTEYIVLKYIAENTQFKFIGRDFAGVWVYKDEPIKSADNEWQNMSVAVPITVFDNLFKFITDADREAFEISNILNNCDVMDD